MENKIDKRKFNGRPKIDPKERSKPVTCRLKQKEIEKLGGLPACREIAKEALVKELKKIKTNKTNDKV